MGSCRTSSSIRLTGTAFWSQLVSSAGFTGTYSGYTLKWYEGTKYLVDVNHGPNSGALVISKRSWDRLTSEHQGVLRRPGEEFSERAWEVGRRTTKEGIDRNAEKEWSGSR